jgi:hypothetical protein
MGALLLEMSTLLESIRWQRPEKQQTATERSRLGIPYTTVSQLNSQLIQWNSGQI